jgi:hypothetical protein
MTEDHAPTKGAIVAALDSYPSTQRNKKTHPLLHRTKPHCQQTSSIEIYA